MQIPATLSRHLSDTEGGIVIVTGAGCSVPDPTDLPTGARLSRRLYESLVDHGELEDGAVDDEGDLTKIASAIEEKYGNLRRLRDYLPIDDLRFAEPNDGYRLAVALVMDRVVAYIVTLNFDLALFQAVKEMVSESDEVRVIAGRGDHGDLENRGVIYLHGHAFQGPEEWVLTRSALVATGDADEEADEVRWRRVIADRVFSSPVTIFAGLGTRIGVIEESCRRIRRTLPEATQIYQVDKGDREDSPYAETLCIGDEEFLSADWIEFMTAIGDRVLRTQLEQVRDELEDLLEAQEDGVGEAFDELFKLIRESGLVEFGMQRGSWLLKNGYGAWHDRLPGWIAEVLLLAEIVRSELDARLEFRDGGIRLLIEDNGVVGRRLSLVHGAGQRWLKVDSKVRHREEGAGWERPHTVLVTGVSDDVRGDEDFPVDVAGSDEEEIEDLVDGPTLRFVDGNQLMREPQTATRL